jgi:hypothetical protein
MTELALAELFLFLLFAIVLIGSKDKAIVTGN